MTDPEFLNWVKAGGFPAAAVYIAYLILTKTDLFKRDDPTRDDVLNEVRSISSEMRSMRNEMTDRLARIETTVSSHERILERRP